MPPITLLSPSESPTPRIVVYAQTFHDPAGNSISLLPLITNQTGVTHVIVAAIHVNDGPGNITLNDDRPEHEKFKTLWGEVRWLQGAGITVMGMLGGAAKGSFERLSGDEASVRYISYVSWLLFFWLDLIFHQLLVPSFSIPSHHSFSFPPGHNFSKHVS